jgi:hypothetical protein
MSRQLRLLREAELVKVSRPLHDRRVLLYGIDRRAHGPITAWLAGTNVGRRPALAIDADGVVHEDKGRQLNEAPGTSPAGADDPAVPSDGSV